MENSCNHFLFRNKKNQSTWPRGHFGNPPPCGHSWSFQEPPLPPPLTTWYMDAPLCKYCIGSLFWFAPEMLNKFSYSKLENYYCYLQAFITRLMSTLTQIKNWTTLHKLHNLSDFKFMDLNFTQSNWFLACYRFLWPLQCSPFIQKA